MKATVAVPAVHPVVAHLPEALHVTVLLLLRVADAVQVDVALQVWTHAVSVKSLQWVAMLRTKTTVAALLPAEVLAVQEALPHPEVLHAVDARAADVALQECQPAVAAKFLLWADMHHTADAAAIQAAAPATLVVPDHATVAVSTAVINPCTNTGRHDVAAGVHSKSR